VTPLQRTGLARALSKLGYCSRTQAAALIRAGRVTKNARIIFDPETPVRLPIDRIEIDGAPLARTPAIYIVMNKPRGVVTTASDEKDRKTVYDLLEPRLPWIGPVGRLDKASEGLLLLTNDSAWAARITDPTSHLDKTYHVQVDCIADRTLLARITANQNPTSPLAAKAAATLRQGNKNSWLEITLDEGKNRQIRRLLDAEGVRVLRLVRVQIGSLKLGDLKKGSTRHLTTEEKKEIDKLLT
jgi:23S rRNA pseudouridine2605 synthase